MTFRVVYKKQWCPELCFVSCVFCLTSCLRRRRKHLPVFTPSWSSSSTTTTLWIPPSRCLSAWGLYPSPRQHWQQQQLLLVLSRLLRLWSSPNARLPPIISSACMSPSICRRMGSPAVSLHRA